MTRRHVQAPIWLSLIVLCTACGGPAREASGTRAAGDSPPSATPKRLTIGILEEPKGWLPWTAGTTTAGGGHQPAWLLTRSLTIADDKGRVQPVLAETLPTLDRGDWRLNPDGTMEQTWKIRPNARWHDGHALTADDFVFGWEMETHPDLPSGNSLARANISLAAAPETRTLVLHFKGTSPIARIGLFDPRPRHILGDVLASGDADQFMNHQFWNSAYVGAGPYRLANWQPGAFLEFSAFADYVEGKPKIDTIVVKFLGDANTLLANVVSGGVEVSLPDGLSVETTAELRRGWAAPGTGNNAVLFVDGRMYRMEFQYRPEYAKPAAARDPRVRRAFYHTIDKDGVNAVEVAALGRLADSWIPPDDGRRPRFRDVIPEWRHDVALAQRILEDSGWRKGEDGVLAHSGTGERMETEIRVTAGQGHVQAMAVMADGWRQVGAVTSEVAIPAALVNNLEYRSTFPFTGLTGHTATLLWEASHFRCSGASRAETRWFGNRNGTCVAGADPLIDRLQVTIDEDQRTELQVQIMRLVLFEDYAQLPLWWQVTPIVFAGGIKGPGEMTAGPYSEPRNLWNVHLWDRVG